ncbi:MAG: DUF4394 domain-containing protein [Planctomycetaceae bacterium]|nr:DUF4394 domain-containing protein [Planctomycetaceae bacterium]
MIRGVRWVLAAVLVGLVSLAGAGPAHAEALLGVTSAKLKIGSLDLGRIAILLKFESAAPEVPSSLRFINGLAADQTLAGISIRPATGELYGIGVLGTFVQLYRIDAATGFATPVGAGFNSLRNPDGTRFGFDFNPTIDRIRMISSASQNLVFHPDTGEVTAAVDVFFASTDPNVGDAPKVASITYDNSVPNATTTVLRGIDVGNNALVRITSSVGEIRTVGTLGFKIKDAPAFDVSGATGIAYAFLVPKGNNGFSPGLFTIDLTTGLATPIGAPFFGLVTLNGVTELPAP